MSIFKKKSMFFRHNKKNKYKDKENDNQNEDENENKNIVEIEKDIDNILLYLKDYEEIKTIYGIT